MAKNQTDENADVTAAQSVEFFQGFRADELGSTKIVRANFAAGVLGLKGEMQKMIDVTRPDRMACPLIVSFRAEYDIDQETASQQPSAPQPIIDATNAGPIVITTPAAHGLLTGTQVTITGVSGNTAANGVFTITVTGPTTFSLNGSVGNGAYLGNGEYVFLIGPLPGTGGSALGSPLVGLVQWGVGGGKNQIEFDIPAARLPELIPPSPNQAFQPISDIGSGVQLYINASHVSVYARNDGNIGPLVAPGQDRVGGPTPAKIICFIAPGASRGGAPLQRTVWVAGGVTIGFPLAPAGVVNVPIPPFARRVRFQRLPIGTTPLRVTFQNNFGITYREFTIPINSEGPIDVEGTAQQLRIENLGAVNVTEMQCVYDVDPI